MPAFAGMTKLIGLVIPAQAGISIRTHDTARYHACHNANLFNRTA
jgi:hypothetical protein